MMFTGDLQTFFWITHRGIKAATLDPGMKNKDPKYYGTFNLYDNIKFHSLMCKY